MRLLAEGIVGLALMLVAVFWAVLDAVHAMDLVEKSLPQKIAGWITPAHNLEIFVVGLLLIGVAWLEHRANSRRSNEKERSDHRGTDTPAPIDNNSDYAAPTAMASPHVEVKPEVSIAPTFNFHAFPPKEEPKLAPVTPHVVAQSGQPGSIQRAAPNMACIGVRVVPVSETGTGIWSDNLGRFEMQIAVAQAQQALIVQFTNAARSGSQNVGGPVKALLIYRSSGHEFRRIVGCWLDAKTDFAEFRVDETQELLVAVMRNDRAITVSKRRISVDLNGEGIETHQEPIPQITEGTVVVRLTDANNGDFLFQGEFRLELKPLNLKPLFEMPNRPRKPIPSE